MTRNIRLIAVLTVLLLSVPLAAQDNKALTISVSYDQVMANFEHLYSMTEWKDVLGQPSYFSQSLDGYSSLMIVGDNRDDVSLAYLTVRFPILGGLEVMQRDLVSSALSATNLSTTWRRNGRQGKNGS